LTTAFRDSDYLLANILLTGFWFLVEVWSLKHISAMPPVTAAGDDRAIELEFAGKTRGDAGLGFAGTWPRWCQSYRGDDPGPTGRRV
jgi:hypothetical protein